MHVYDEIAHVGIVHTTLRRGFPGFVGFRIVGVDADDVEGVRVDEFGAVQSLQLAAEDEVEQLLVSAGAVGCSHVDRSSEANLPRLLRYALTCMHSPWASSQK